MSNQGIPQAGGTGSSASASASASTGLTTKRKRLLIPLSRILEVKRELERRQQLEGEEYLQADHKPITLATKVTSKLLTSWLSNNEGYPMGFKMELLRNGDLIGVEMTSDAHGDAIFQVIMALSDDSQLGASPGVDVWDAQGTQWKTPDLKINVYGQYAGGVGPNVRPNKFTTAVVEIGICQSTPDLCDKLGFYIANVPSLQFYISIKRYGAGGMIALVFSQASGWEPTSIVSFGTTPLHGSVISYLRSQLLAAPPGQLQQSWESLCVGVGYGGNPCNAAGFPVYLLSFPAAVLFLGRVGGIPADLNNMRAPGMYVLDLFHIHQEWVA